MMSWINKRHLIGLLFISCYLLFSASAWAQVTGVLQTAQKTNDYFMMKYSDPTLPTNVGRIRPSSLWTRAVYYEGLMALNAVDPQQRYLDYVCKWADFHQWTPRNGVKTTDADDQCCEQTYIEYNQLTGLGSLAPTRENLAKQMASGRVDYWTWIDAIQMAMPVYAKMYAITGDRHYIDYALKSYLWSRNTCGGGLFNVKEGLWWRDKDYVPPYKEHDGQNCYWSRGNGWVYAALVRSMEVLSPKDKAYKQFLKDFLLMSKALLKCQHKDGFWGVSLVSPSTFPGPEMTGTALFLYGISWGIRNGILEDKVYRPACDKAWKALASCVHESGFLGWNQGTGKDPSAGQPVTFTKVPDFEDYGTGCFLLGATEYYRLTALEWPESQPEAKAGTRWWWLGSAVDKDNLQWTMQQYANHGIGAVEITPIYGVQGNEANNIPYLSDQWMEMLREVQKNGQQTGIEVDMATGTGWPFGGPWVPLEESACKAIFVNKAFTGNHVEGLDLSVPEKDAPYSRLNKVMAYWQGQVYDVTPYVTDNRLTWSLKDILKQQIATATDKTLKKTLKLKLRESATAQWQVMALHIRYGVMKVKRAAPGGEGLVIDHFDQTAVHNYLAHIESAFERTGTPYPHTFFNDSYEVSEGTWTPTLLNEFQKRRGYRLEDYFLLLNEGDPKIVSDYRETLSDLLLENFTQQWTAWAHRHGAITRNQAHGSPANLIDCYAAVDIPEIEGFGLSDLGIKGLRQDPGKTRKNDSDYSMFKYAPSAAHVCGKPYTSSETFTWLTEHFRTSLSQLKPDLDLMFCAGVNHIFFHGTCYSPKDDPWPGWKFYASIDMSPTNSIWRDAPYMMQYVERCQSFLQWGLPDNDFLVYLPIRDMWQKNTQKLLMQFSIHAMGELAPEFRQTILDIDQAGFDCDYISERLLMGVSYQDGMLVTEAGTRYKALIIPGSGNMPEKVKAHIADLKALGAIIIHGTDMVGMNAAAKPETMKSKHGLKAIRRKNDRGYHYFIANLTPNDINEYIKLAVDFKDALWFDPMTGNRYTVNTDDNGNILLCLRSGQSMILETLNQGGGLHDPILSQRPVPPTHLSSPIPLNGKWSLSFIEESPRVKETYTLNTPQTWETLGDSAAITMGTGVYTTHIYLKKKDLKDVQAWQIDLGDVRESARVYINGQFIGCAWAVPFVLDCNNTLKAGDNEIRIEVTNLPANRIADLDRRGIQWRKMEEINVVDINYKKTTFDSWEPMPSGLNSEVKLILWKN